MKRNWVLTIACVPAAVLAAAAFAYASTGSLDRPAALEASAAHELRQPVEEKFDDAPLGVDPIVTGPVSSEFRTRQKALGCDTAQWPHVPSACYPATR